MATDPFKAEAFRERRTLAGGLLLLIAFVFALLWWALSFDFPHERQIEATVVRVGTYPDPLATGDSPILTLRLADGSIRQLPTSWPAAINCRAGSNISLLKSGNTLRVGLLGCNRDH